MKPKDPQKKLVYAWEDAVVAPLSKRSQSFQRLAQTGVTVLYLDAAASGGARIEPALTYRLLSRDECEAFEAKYAGQPVASGQA
jgi:hypothetical protein